MGADSAGLAPFLGLPTPASPITTSDLSEGDINRRTIYQFVLFFRPNGIEGSQKARFDPSSKREFKLQL